LRLALAVISVLALAGGTVDVVVLRPEPAQPKAPPPERGALATYLLPDGTMLISRRDWNAGIYPIGRRFVPALP